MPRHITPAERAAIVARYQQTANASAVGREFAVDEKTVRKILAAAGAPKKSELHAQACARGVREGRRALTGTARLLRRWLEEHGRPDAPTMEPGDVARIANAVRGIVSGVVECDEHADRKRLARLTRDLRRKEIELAALKIKAGGVERHELSYVTPELAAQAAREVFGSPSALETQPGGQPGQSSADSVASDAVPVSAPVGD